MACNSSPPVSQRIYHDHISESACDCVLCDLFALDNRSGFVGDMDWLIVSPFV